MSDTYFISYFPSCSLSFHLLNRVLHQAKVFILMKFNLSILFFYECFWCGLKIFHRTLGTKDFLLSSKVLVLHLTLKHMINFELLFIILRIKLIHFFAYVYPIAHHNLLKRLTFLHWIVCAPLSHIDWPYLHRAVSGFSILFYWSMSTSLVYYSYTVLIIVTI